MAMTQLFSFSDVKLKVESSDYKDKVALIKAGYYFSDFVEDTDWHVRAAMADEICALVDETLAKDDNAKVRQEVAKNTIKADILLKLLDDPDTLVSKMATFRLLQDEDYRQQVLDKFSNDCTAELNRDNYADTVPVPDPSGPSAGPSGPSSGPSAGPSGPAGQ